MGSGLGVGSGSGIPPAPAAKHVTHGHVMTQVGVVKNLIDAIKSSHSDADDSVKEISTHAKTLKGIQTNTLTELTAMETKLLNSKVKLEAASGKLAEEDKKITE